MPILMSSERALYLELRCCAEGEEVVVVEDA